MPSTTERGLGGEWQKLTRQCRAVYPDICHLCGEPINRGLPRTHPMSYTVDHLDPRATHGTGTPTIDRVRPAHRRCNSRKGKGTTARRRWSL